MRLPSAYGYGTKFSADEVYAWAKIRRPGVRRLRPAEIESLREDSRLALKIARVLHVLENVKQ